MKRSSLHRFNKCSFLFANVKDELFSVAPMMGHTNRHYRYFFRLLSKRAHLYTEMIPSSQIVRAFRRAKAIYQNGDPFSNESIHPEEILELMHYISNDPSKEYTTILPHERDVIPLTLHQLLSTSGSDEYPVVLQLGGRNPDIVGAAAAIGSAYSHDYIDINLNCGCPSNAVGGRSGGCALMKEPDTVARCVESMKEQLSSLKSLEISEHADNKMSEKKIITPSVSVKHRLGVRDACTFDGEIDRQKSDDEAFEECRSFVRTVSMSGAVSKFQVHARLGLLGEFLDNQEYTDKEEDVFTVKQHYKLWVPNSSNVTIGNDVKRTKIDHKRVQIQAKRRAKRATLLNRNVPPLRPDVVHRIADEFPDLKFVSNGGINSFEQVKDLINASRNEVIGAMVGRSVINHPCSFAHVDSLWGDNSITPMPTRGDVLENYIQYCDAEEFRVTSMGVSSLYLENMRKRLIAVPFHLFSGEVGSDVFQRQLKKLRDKTDRLKASSILSAAATFVPTETMHRKINEYLSWQQIEQYRNSAVRGSAMQRVIY